MSILPPWAGAPPQASLVTDSSADARSPIVIASAPRNRALRDFVSVLDYGPWTSADMTAQLLQATSDARNRGRKIWIPSSPGGGGTTYKVTGTITDPANPNPLLLEGDGSTSVLDCSSIQANLNVIDAEGSIGAQIALTADAHEGDLTLTLTGTAGLTVGQRVLVGSLDNTQASTGQKPGEISRIYSINAGANQITLYSPLHATYPVNDGVHNPSGGVWPITNLAGNRLRGFRINGPTAPTTTIAAGSNGAVLPQAVINVASTAGFPPSGVIFIGGQTITYTGTTSTTFTGCTGGTVTLSTGELVLNALVVIGCLGKYWSDFEIEAVDCIQTQYNAFQLWSSVQGRARGGYGRDFLYGGGAVGFSLAYACQDIVIEGYEALNMWHAVALGGGTSTPGGWPRRVLVTGAQCTDCNLNCHPCGEQIDFINNHVDGLNQNPTGTEDGIVFNAQSGKIQGNTFRNIARHPILVQPATTQPTMVDIEDNMIVHSQAPAEAIAITPTVAFAGNAGLLFSIRRNKILSKTLSIDSGILCQGAANVVAGQNYINGHTIGIKFDAACVNCEVEPTNTIINCPTPIQDLSMTGSAQDPAPKTDPLDFSRSSECASMHRLFATGAVTMTSGQFLGALAVSRTARTYTQIRFATGTAAISGSYTDFRAAVCDSTGTILQQTAESHATVTLANTLYTLNLNASVTLAQGQQVILGAAIIATTLTSTMRGISPTGNSVLNSLTPKLNVSAAGALTTGNPLTNPGTGGGSNAVLAMELI